MVITTRSMDQDSIFMLEGNLEQIKHTLDPIQKVCLSKDVYMPYWRYTMYHRYVGRYAPKGLSTKWTNYGPCHRINSAKLQVDYTIPIPSDLYQSTLEIRTGYKKQLKIHIYYTTAKILIQGKACKPWVETEFKKLCAIVHTLATCCDRHADNLAVTDLRHPDPSTAAYILTSGSAVHSAEDDDKRCTVVLPENPSTPHTSVEAGDLEYQQKPGILCLPPSPLPPMFPSSPSLRSPANNVICQSDPPSPSFPQPHLHAEQEMNQSPNPFSPELHEISPSDAHTTTPSISSSGTDDSNFDESCVSHNDIAPTSIPSSSVSQDYARDQLSVSDNASQSVDSASVTENDTTEDQSSVADITSQSVDSASVTEDNNKSTMVTCTHEECVSRVEFDAIIQTLQAEISALRSALHEARQTFKIEVDAITTQIHHLKVVSPNPPSSKHPQNKASTSRVSPKAKTINSQSLSDHHSPPPHSEKSTPELLLPPPMHTGSTADAKSKTDSNNSVEMIRHDKSTVADNMQSSMPHPLKHVAVAKDTTHILLGDSVIKSVDLSRSSPPHSVPQKVCVSGLTITQLTDWLGRQTPTHTMKRATLHVGINDCNRPTASTDGISTEKWKQLLSQCRRIFPRASLQVSAILPARGRNPLNAVIHPSNKNLQLVCDSMRVQFCDHTTTFITASGAPRMALYRDAIHPTKKGTARLAEKLFSQHFSYNSTGMNDKVTLPASRIKEIHVAATNQPSSSLPPSNNPPSSSTSTRQLHHSVHNKQPFHHHPALLPSPPQQLYADNFPPLSRTFNRPPPPPPHHPALLPSPHQQLYADNFSPLSRTFNRPPPPPPHPTITQKADTWGEDHHWSPQPAPLMPPPPPYPMCYPPFPPRGPPAAPWYWPPYFLPLHSRY